MEINFGEIGSSLGTRSLALKFRSQIEISLANREQITFNFSKVDVVSHSFADECFGKLLLSNDLKKLRKNTTFKNTNPKVKKMISFVFKERLLELNAF